MAHGTKRARPHKPSADEPSTRGDDGGPSAVDDAAVHDIVANELAMPLHGTPQLFYSGKRCSVKFVAARVPRLTQTLVDDREYLSNFYPCIHGVTVGGRTFPTSEHAYQALIWSNPVEPEPPDIAGLRATLVDAIAQSKTPNMAFFLSRFASTTINGTLSNACHPHTYRPLRQFVNELYLKGLRRTHGSSVREFRIMLDCVHAKFAQNPDLAHRLLATGTDVLTEHTTSDSVWADAGDGSGRNWLGKCLMLVRARLSVAAP